MRQVIIIALIVASIIASPVLGSYFKDKKIVASPNTLTPAATANIHVDGGTASTSVVKFTIGSTTGQANTDGFDIGIDATGAAVISQLEDNAIFFRANGTEACKIFTDSEFSTRFACGTSESRSPQKAINWLGKDITAAASSTANFTSSMHFNAPSNIVGTTMTSTMNLGHLEATHAGNISTLVLNNSRQQSDSGAAGTIGTLDLYRGIVNISGGETYSNMSFFGARNPTVGGSAVITKLNGMYLANMTMGTNNTNLLIGTFSGPTGNYSIYNTSTYQNYMSGNTGFGASATTPAANMHVDAGTGTASSLKFTANATTGQSSSDGFDVGITTTGLAELRQRENVGIDIYTNNTQAIGISATQSVVVKNKIEFEDPDSGTAVVQVQASESIVTPYTMTLPSARGTNNQVLAIGGVRGATVDLVFSTVSGSGGGTASEIIMDGGNGNGGSSSGETRVRNFVNTRKSVGSCIVYTARTTTAGDKFTIQSGCDDRYCIFYNDKDSAGAFSFGITVNGSALDTSLGTPLTYAQGLRGMSVSSAGTFTDHVATCVDLAAGDVVRAGANTPDNGNTTNTMFIITKMN